MTNTHIPHLPNEILYEIASYVADEDILDLRLSAKVFQSVTANRFAVTFFENRAYDMSIQGLEALVEITKQLSFAPHIKTIVIGHGGKVYPGKHYDLLVQAFQNLAHIGNTISLGMRQVRKCRSYNRRHHVVMRQTIKFFRERVLRAAALAHTPLGDLVADVQSASQNRRFPSVVSGWTWSFMVDLRGVAAGSGPFNCMKIKVDSPGSDSSSSGHVIFNERDSRLEISRTGV